MVWNIPAGQPGLAAWLCSLPAEHGKLEKILDFLATVTNISVLSTLFSYEIPNTAATGKKLYPSQKQDKPMGLN